MANPKMLAGVPLMCGGVPALSCCHCCSGYLEKTLYLTITDLIMDPGSTCFDALCDAPLELSAFPSDNSSGTAIWNVTSGASRFRGALGLACSESPGPGLPSNVFYLTQTILGVPQIKDGVTTRCTFSVDSTPNFGAGVCDPFYLDARLNLQFANSLIDPVCATGSARFIITE